MCWALAHREGEDKLKWFLEPFKQGNPPFLLSDGFPRDLLPKPLSADINVEAEVRKSIKRIDFVLPGDFNLIRNAQSSQPADRTSGLDTYLSSHNTISRLTNSTLAEGGVYSLKQTFVPEINIYLKAITDDWKEKVVDLLKDLAKGGYGRKKSIGTGHFLVQEVMPFSFSSVDRANGFVTLSNFCPAENDPTEGLFKTFVKYGKLGEEFTFCGNPFKRPLVMIRAGSVFKTNGSPREFYGRMIKEGIAHAKHEVVQYEYAFTVPLIYSDFKGENP